MPKMGTKVVHISRCDKYFAPIKIMKTRQFYSQIDAGLNSQFGRFSASVNL